MDSTVSFFENENCYLPDQGNVCHLTNKFTKTRLNQFIKYLLSSIFFVDFWAAKAFLIKIRISVMVLCFLNLFFTYHISLWKHGD